MANRNHVYIYRISRNYTRCEVWSGTRKFRNRIGTSVIVPDKGLKLSERKEIVTTWLSERFGLRVPKGSHNT
jgi:hypothetical protein